ncbi:tRNA (adenosine(37)-N6)-threonylcarbamoyltransferase complex dimerization subunit type 1 TsaB [Pedobacter sp.]|nr:tRNA (adenosine(37)-N6)-threonylcarbamoyltransferase complex dimerization subunit type 1 TsaB [Candidatus Saccharibacteria bacterium]
MILAIKTDSPIAELYLFDDQGQEVAQDIWEAGRSLAKDLLRHIDTLIGTNGSWLSLSGLVVFRGPGSFTGLRIGITTANTISYANQLPIVGECGDAWAISGCQRLMRGENDQIVLPEYGSAPHITAPKK